MIHSYVLDAEHRPIGEPDLDVWARWMMDFDNHRRVAEDFTRFHRISTVFLGFDHGWGKGPPILFETMVFEREAAIKETFGRLMPVHDDVEQWRYASWDDAVTGHAAILSRYRRAEEEALKAMAKAKI